MAEPQTGDEDDTDKRLVPDGGNELTGNAVSLTPFYPSSVDIGPGETTEFTINPSNETTEAGEYVAELIINGTVEETRTVMLDPGESQEVVFEWTTEETGTYDVSIPPRDDFTTVEVTYTEAEGVSINRIFAGEDGTPTAGGSVDWRVKGVFGEPEIRVDPQLDIELDGDQVDQRTITGDEGTAVSGEFPAPSTPGEYEVGATLWHPFGRNQGPIDGPITTTVQVEAGSDVPDIQQVTQNVNQDVVQSGETLTAYSTVENNGSGDGTHEFTMNVDAEIVQEEVVTIPEGETITYNFSHVMDEPEGNYNVYIDGSVFSVRVEGEGPDIQLVDITEPAGPVASGDSITISVTLVNNGDGSGPTTVSVNGRSEEVNLAPGEERTVDLAVTVPDTSDTVDYDVDYGVGTESISIPMEDEEDTTEEDGANGFIETIDTPPAVDPSATWTATVHVTNNGTDTADGLQVTGRGDTSPTFTVISNWTETIPVTVDAPGPESGTDTYTFELQTATGDSIDTESVTVNVEGVDGSDGADDTTDDGGTDDDTTDDGGTDDGSAGPPDGVPAFEATDIYIAEMGGSPPYSASEVQQYDEVTVVVEVANTGNAPGVVDVVFEGQSESLDVSPGSANEANFPVAVNL